MLPRSQEPHLRMVQIPFLLSFFSSLCSNGSEVNITERLQESTKPLLFSLQPYKINMSEVLKFAYTQILVATVTNILDAPLEKSSNTNLVKTSKLFSAIILYCPPAQGRDPQTFLLFILIDPKSVYKLPHTANTVNRAPKIKKDLNSKTFIIVQTKAMYSRH